MRMRASYLIVCALATVNTWAWAGQPILFEPPPVAGIEDNQPGAKPSAAQGTTGAMAEGGVPSQMPPFLEEGATTRRPATLPHDPAYDAAASRARRPVAATAPAQNQVGKASSSPASSDACGAGLGANACGCAGACAGECGVLRPRPDWSLSACPSCRCWTGYHCRLGKPWNLPEPCLLRCLGLDLGGWVDQGVSVVANNPADRYNGPVTFNDRDGEYQVNQVCLYLKRDLRPDRCPWDVGGRLDILYGTDARFIQAIDGLESDWGQAERFYQLAVPQFYLDVALNPWTLRIGRFYTILGYESVMAPENFFYSHAYVHQYGEPFTHTGMLLMCDVGAGLTLAAGLQRGNDQFDDTDGLNALGFLGGLHWRTCCDRLTVSFAISADEVGRDRPVTIYSLVTTWKVTRRLKYVIQHDYGEVCGAPQT